MTSPRTHQSIERNKFPLLAAAAAIGAAGFLITAPAPAQAAPCSQWGFPNGGNGFTNDLGQSLLFQAAGKTETQAAASWVGPNGTKGSGYLNGSINGTGLSFTWKGDGGPPNFTGGATITFSGTVNNDGSAGGTVSYSDGPPGSFTSNKPMTCLDAPPAAPPPPPPAAPEAPAAPVVPATPATPSATVTSDVDVYNVKNEPDGTGHVVGILRSGSQVQLVGSCQPQSWCQVSGAAVPGGKGWVWGALQLP
jgi:hypothetical protein